MGWFLRRNKTKKSGGKNGGRKQTKSRATSTSPQWDPQRTMRALKVFGSVVVLAALAAGWYYGQSGLRHYARATRNEAVLPTDVLLQAPPAWMSEGVKQELRQIIAREMDTDPMDNTDLRAAASALRRSAWVEPGQVQQVKRLADGRVAVAANYRTPMAVIQARNGYYLVSEQGIRLPMLYEYEDLRYLDLPVIERVRSAPPTAGEVWPGADVQGGLAMVRLLAREPFRNQVRAIDVGRRDAAGRLRLVLLTNEGEVHWGLPPGEEAAIEPTVEQKLKSLHEVAEAYEGRIDANGRIVDLYVYGARIHEGGMPLEQYGGAGDYTFGP